MSLVSTVGTLEYEVALVAFAVDAAIMLRGVAAVDVAVVAAEAVAAEKEAALE